MLNRTAARFYFGDTDPIGKRIAFERRTGRGPRSSASQRREARERRAGMARFVYLPIPQTIDRINRLTLAVRASAAAGSLAGPVHGRCLEQVRRCW